MRLLYNMKIRVKFLGSFALLIITMIIVGMVGVKGMGEISEANEYVYENNYKSTVQVEIINAGLSDVRMGTQKLVNRSNVSAAETILEEIANYDAINEQAMETYRNSIVEEEDRAIFTKLESAMNEYLQYRAELFEYIGNGKYIEANKFNTEFVDPASQAVQEYINQAVDYNLEDAQQSVDAAMEEYKQSANITYLILIVAFFVSIIIGLIMSSVITRPLNVVRAMSKKIADGDLSIRFEQRYLKQKDEIGMLARNIEEMKKGLIETVSGIKQSANILGDQVKATNKTLAMLNDHIIETSAATEALSAAMEETGAAAEEMNTTASEIERAVDSVADKAEEGAGKSNEIHVRATELGQNVNQSIEKSNQIFNEIKGALEQALKDSKAVDEINALADAILSITSQTTLLALNASIEAARAGEAGKGFAVVANEISALADNSKNTVNQIQAITKVVMSAVNNLAKNSNNLLNFVASDVNKDYADMLAAAESYTTDAVYVSDMTSDLNATSEELNAGVNLVMTAINEVAQAAQEGARKTSAVAQQTSDISTNAATIVENMKHTQRTSEGLISLVDRFKLS